MVHRSYDNMQNTLTLITFYQHTYHTTASQHHEFNFIDLFISELQSKRNVFVAIRFTGSSESLL